MGTRTSTYESIIGSLLLWIITWFPGLVGDYLRYGYFKKRLKKIGVGVRICSGVEIQSPEFVSIGNNTWIDRNVLIIAGPISEGSRSIQRKNNTDFHGDEGFLTIGRGCHICPNTTIQAHGGVNIGDYVATADGSRIYSASQHYRIKSSSRISVLSMSSMAPPSKQHLIISGVVLQDGCAIGMNSVVLPGSTIGEGSWIGVLSCVRGKIPPFSIASGCPAIKIKGIYDE